MGRGAARLHRFLPLRCASPTAPHGRCGAAGRLHRRASEARNGCKLATVAPAHAPRQGVEQVRRPPTLVALLLRPEPARPRGRGEQQRLDAEGPLEARADEGGTDHVVPVQRLEPGSVTQMRQYRLGCDSGFTIIVTENDPKFSLLAPGRARRPFKGLRCIAHRRSSSAGSRV